MGEEQEEIAKDKGKVHYKCSKNYYHYFHFPLCTVNVSKKYYNIQFRSTGTAQ